MKDEEVLSHKGLSDHKVFYYVKKPIQLSKKEFFILSSVNLSWAHFPPGNFCLEEKPMPPFEQFPWLQTAFCGIHDPYL